MSDVFAKSLDAVSAMYGVPHSDFTYVFAGKPFIGKSNGTLDDGFVFPIGACITFQKMDGRTANQIKIMGSPDFVPLSGTGMPKSGMLQGLLVLSDMSQEDGVTADPGSDFLTQGKWHLLKRMYSYMLAKYPELVDYFYSSKQIGSPLGLKPVAYNSTDMWRNFSSSILYDMPIGLYLVSKSTAGQTIQASYLSGVRLQGQQVFTVSAVNNQPMFEQVQFAMVEEIPMDPGIILSQQAGDRNLSNDTTFLGLVKSYLGV